MRKSEFSQKLHKEMACVHVSPELRRRALASARGKEQTRMKKKVSAALVFALVAVMMGAVALAAASRAGILDFAGRYANTYIPEDAQSYIQSDVATLEEEGVVVNIRELYYDGRTMRMTVDMTPRSDKVLLLGMDVGMTDNWQSLWRDMNGGWNMTPTSARFTTSMSRRATRRPTTPTSGRWTRRTAASTVRWTTRSARTAR